jgi:hypothetical protein
VIGGGGVGGVVVGGVVGKGVLLPAPLGLSVFVVFVVF